MQYLPHPKQQIQNPDTSMIITEHTQRLLSDNTSLPSESLNVNHATPATDQLVLIVLHSKQSQHDDDSKVGFYQRRYTTKGLKTYLPRNTIEYFNMSVHRSYIISTHRLHAVYQMRHSLKAGTARLALQYVLHEGGANTQESLYNASEKPLPLYRRHMTALYREHNILLAPQVQLNSNSFGCAKTIQRTAVAHDTSVAHLT